MGTDWRDSRIRYLLHFSDGGSGMRYFDEPLAPADGIRDGGVSYVIERVEPAPSPAAFGHAWAARVLRTGRSGDAT